MARLNLLVAATVLLAATTVMASGNGAHTTDPKLSTHNTRLATDPKKVSARAPLVSPAPTVASVRANFGRRLLGAPGPDAPAAIDIGAAVAAAAAGGEVAPARARAAASRRL
jgi:murein DD-endopeptidase MepM/ murein hydrolase activator NlpD